MQVVGASRSSIGPVVAAGVGRSSASRNARGAALPATGVGLGRAAAWQYVAPRRAQAVAMKAVVPRGDGLGGDELGAGLGGQQQRSASAGGLPGGGGGGLGAGSLALGLAVAGVVAMGGVEAAQALGLHEEPANALSIPTWAIHISSLVEWLVGMGLVWKFADASGTPEFKGLTWGMLPLHASGICACTYHLFYNAESLEVLVALQALLTCVGNCTLWWAAYRIYLAAEAEREAEEAASSSSSTPTS